MDFSAPEEAWFGDLPEGPARRAAADSVAALVAKVHGVRPLPDAVQRLMDVTSDGEFDVKDVARIIESDTTLAARVLRLVNSAGYGLKSQCKSVPHAVVLLGGNKVRELATTMAIFDMFEDGSPQASAIAEHATMVAAIARLLAPTAAIRPDDAFTCGLLHDIGKLMLLQAEGDEYARLFSSADRDTLHHQETATYGFDHAVLAGHVLRVWRLPEPVPTVVRLHHDASRAYKMGPPVSGLVSLVRLADRMVDRVRDHASPPMEWLEQIDRDESATYNGVGADVVRVMWPRLRKACGIEEPQAEEVSESPASPMVEAQAEPPVRQEMPCWICNGNTYGKQCARCRGYVCTAHDPGAEPWCIKCEGVYKLWLKDKPTDKRLIAVAAASLVMTIVMVASPGSLVARLSFGGVVGAIFLIAVVMMVRGRSNRREQFLGTNSR